MDFLGGGFFCASADDVWNDAETPEVFEGVLGGFGFELFTGVNPRNVNDGDVKTVVPPDAVGEEADGFDKRKAFVVSDGAADFYDVDVGRFGGFGDFFLNEVSEMRNELDSFAFEATRALFVDELFEDGAGEGDGVFIGFEIEKALVVAEV